MVFGEQNSSPGARGLLISVLILVFPKDTSLHKDLPCYFPWPVVTELVFRQML